MINDEKQFYRQAFGRNLGILTGEEQEKLRNSVITIAGLGGVGGLTAERIVRLGIGYLVIADPDVFEPSNLNRQFACTAETIGRKKAEATGEALKAINPSLKLKAFPEGVTESNAEAFMVRADLAVVAIDLFHLKETTVVFRAARERGIFALMSASVGFGAPLLVFDPKGMTFEEYLRLTPDGEPPEGYQLPTEKVVIKKPAYIPQETIRRVREGGGRFSPPSVSPGCSLAASLLAAEVVALLLGKRRSVVVPRVLKIDLLDQEMVIEEFPRISLNPK